MVDQQLCVDPEEPVEQLLPLKLVLLAVFLVLILTPTVKAVRKKLGAKKTPV